MHNQILKPSNFNVHHTNINENNLSYSKLPSLKQNPI